MASVTDDYLQKLRVREAKAKEAQKLVDVVQAAATILRRWPTAVINGATNSKGEQIGFPPEIMGNRSDRTIDVSTWPSANDIAIALSEWHNAHWEVKEAWGQIPEDQRGGLTAP